MPQTQGAKLIYLEYVDPFLLQYERQIEEAITQVHDRAKSAGLNYFYQAIDLIREKALGLPPSWSAEAAPPPPPSGPTSYAQSLFSRFNLPASAPTGAAASAASRFSPASDIYSLLSSAVTAVGSTGQSREVQAEELSASGNLIPRDIASASKAERAEYISSQKARLQVLLSAFDQEHRNLGPGDEDNVEGLAYGTSYEQGSYGLRKNRSENSFENIEHEDLAASSSIENRYDDGNRSRRSRRSG